MLLAITFHNECDLSDKDRFYTLDATTNRCGETKFPKGSGLPVSGASDKGKGYLIRSFDFKRPDQYAMLNDSAVGTKRSQVTGRIQEPEPFPFVNDHSQIFTGEQQLLNATLGAGRVDWQKATDRSRKTNGQGDQLQSAAHRGFLHERERQCCQRSVTIETLYKTNITRRLRRVTVKSAAASRPSSFQVFEMR